MMQNLSSDNHHDGSSPLDANDEPPRVEKRLWDESKINMAIMISMFAYGGVGVRILLSLATPSIGGSRYPFLSQLDNQCSEDGALGACPYSYHDVG